MKNLIHTIRYYLLYSFFFLTSLFPLSVLYVFSDFIYFWVYVVVRYRRKVVRRNLIHSFPEKDVCELKLIEKKFYHMLCDYFLEMIKMTTMPVDEMQRRITFEGFEPAMEELKNGKPVGVYLTHTFNWEWIASMPVHFEVDKEKVVFVQIYHRLADKSFNKLMLRIRGRFGGDSIPMPDTARAMIHYKKDGRAPIIGFIADQAPKLNMIDHWVTFLNQDTPVITGTERLLKKLNYTVVFCSLSQTKRGYYKCKADRMIKDTAGISDYELTDMYYCHLEANIRRNPASWLWSHKRWKRTRSDYEAYLFKKEQEKGERINKYHKE